MTCSQKELEKLSKYERIQFILTECTTKKISPLTRRKITVGGSSDKKVKQKTKIFIEKAVRNTNE